MKKTFFTLIIFFLSISLFSQSEEVESEKGHSHNIKNNKSFIKGGFGQFYYNKNEDQKGNLSISDFVLRAGYKFSDKWYFFGKVAVEDLDEFSVENLFLNYAFNHELNFRAGLMALPVGHHNQEHTPNLFLGVELPIMYQNLIPFEWNDVAVGIHGEIHELELDYQLYLSSGLKSYDTSGGLISSMNGFRDGRQEEFSCILPAIVGRVDYNGIDNLRLGTSLFVNQTNSDNVKKISELKDDKTSLLVSIITADAEYHNLGFSLKGEVVYSHLSGTNEYNKLTIDKLNSSMIGGYAELGYNVLTLLNSKQKLIPFVRYGISNTQLKRSKNVLKNDAFEQKELNIGLNYAPTENILLKTDYTLIKDGNNTKNNSYRVALCFLW